MADSPRLAGAYTGTQRSMSRPSSGPAMTSVGIATMSPKMRVWLWSALSRAMAVWGPGWGGTRPCRTDRPARAGIPMRIRVDLVRRATRMTTGTRITTPTSKNSGSPMIAAISAIPHGSLLPESRSVIRLTMVSAPPESARILPSIAPRAMRMPTAPAVLPNPLMKLVRAAVGEIQATAASAAEPRIRARNGCIFSQLMSTTMTAMPTRQAMTSWVFPALEIGSAAGRAVRTAPVADMRPPGGGVVQTGGVSPRA